MIRPIYPISLMSQLPYRTSQNVRMWKEKPNSNILVLLCAIMNGFA